MAAQYPTTTNVEMQAAPTQVVYAQDPNQAYAAVPPQGQQAVQVVYAQPPTQQVVYQQPPTQQVVYVQQGAPQGQVVMTGGGEIGQPQMVVIAQQPPVATAEAAPDRESRWAYLVLMIGFASYHLFSFWWWFIISIILPGEHGVLFFFCGAVPALVCFAWAVNDSTVYCCNPAGQVVTKMCCCECISGLIMVIPMGIAGLLRFIFWIYMTSLIIDFVGTDNNIADNIFWFFLTATTMDLGPIIVISVDWWFYYQKQDYQGILGVHKNPMRCVVAMSIVMMITAFAIIAMAEGTGELWVVILHALFTTTAIGFLTFCNFTGQITGNIIGNQILRIVCFILGGALAFVLVTTWIYSFILMSYGMVFFGWFALFLYTVYYNGLMVPIIWGLFSFKVEQPIVPNQV